MGVLNEMDDAGGLNLILSNRLGVQGAAARKVATELFPMMALEVDRPEWHFLAQSRLCRASRNQGAVGGAYSAVGVANMPGGSGVLSVVEEIIVHETSGGLATYWVGFNNLQSLGGGFTTTPGQVVDSRWNEDPSTATFYGTTVGSLTSIIEVVLSSGYTSTRIKGPFVLGPGSFVWVQGAAQNQRVDASFIWRERAATAGELRGAVTF